MRRTSARPRASVLIIAGGRGTRFSPASREARPKPLFSIDGKNSLLADTIARHIKNDADDLLTLFGPPPAWSFACG